MYYHLVSLSDSVLQYHSQETDIDTIYLYFLHFQSVICTHFLCMFIFM